MRPGFEEDNPALRERRPDTTGLWNEDSREAADYYHFKWPLDEPMIFPHQKWRVMLQLIRLPIPHLRNV